MFCPRCGTEQGTGNLFCSKCGALLDSDNGNQREIPHNEPPRYEVYEGKKVSKIAYALICFFLGGLGIHKFYGGRPGLGVVYILLLFLFGISIILSLIEFLIVIFKDSDENGDIVIPSHGFFP